MVSQAVQGLARVVTGGAGANGLSNNDDDDDKSEFALFQTLSLLFRFV